MNAVIGVLTFWAPELGPTAKAICSGTILPLGLVIQHSPLTSAEPIELHVYP